jgi:hypothetical protein
MTSKELATHDHFYNGLILQYSDFDFIINRDYVFASITLETYQTIEDASSLFKKGIPYKDGIVPVVEFAPYLQEVFGILDESKSSIILIVETEKLTIKNQKRLFSHLSKIRNKDLTSQYIALQAGSRAKVEKFPLDELRLTPGNLQKSQWHAGVLAMRFLQEIESKEKHLRIQYLLDMERIIFNKIFPAEKLLEEIR